MYKVRSSVCMIYFCYATVCIKIMLVDMRLKQNLHYTLHDNLRSSDFAVRTGNWGKRQGCQILSDS